MLPFQKEYSWVNDDNNEADVISRYVIPFLDRIIESIQTQYLSSYQSSRDNMLSSPVNLLFFGRFHIAWISQHAWKGLLVI